MERQQPWVLNSSRRSSRNTGSTIPSDGRRPTCSTPCRNLGLNGHGIYEFRYREGGRQLDKAVWGNHVGRFALQVKGGIYDMDEAGQWYRIRPDGTRERVSCPLEETEDGCMEMHNAIKEATGYSNFVVGVTLFPDMERNARMEEVARRRNHVYIIWGLANLREDLERTAREAPVRHPPKPSHSENECRKVNKLQYRDPADQGEGGREMPVSPLGSNNSNGDGAPDHPERGRRPHQPRGYPDHSARPAGAGHRGPDIHVRPLARPPFSKGACGNPSGASTLAGPPDAALPRCPGQQRPEQFSN